VRNAQDYFGLTHPACKAMLDIGWGAVSQTANFKQGITDRKQMKPP
jgi:hypothetical protein